MLSVFASPKTTEDKIYILSIFSPHNQHKGESTDLSLWCLADFARYDDGVMTVMVMMTIVVMMMMMMMMMTVMMMTVMMIVMMMMMMIVFVFVFFFVDVFFFVVVVFVVDVVDDGGDDDGDGNVLMMDWCDGDDEVHYCNHYITINIDIIDVITKWCLD